MTDDNEQTFTDHRAAVGAQVERGVMPPAWTPASDTEELRLAVAHYKTALRLAATMARGTLRTNSRDIEDWREDLQVLADCLERQIEA